MSNYILSWVGVEEMETEGNYCTIKLCSSIVAYCRKLKLKAHKLMNKVNSMLVIENYEIIMTIKN
jgi:hypothetical protein